MLTTKEQEFEYNWLNDPLPEVLQKDIENGQITQSIKPAEAAKCQPEHKAMGKKTFASRLKGM
eukprot:scaffold5478_cov161-Amphora_coffeaeformis.AAC.7